MQRADGVVLATPVGMVGHPGMPFDPALLRAHMWVSDVIYAPLETEMLAQARNLGCRTMNGGAMLCFQAARAFQLFTGMDADAERMLATFLHATGAVTPPTVDRQEAAVLKAAMRIETEATFKPIREVSADVDRVAGEGF
jgi:hypothetical protein